MSSHYTPERHVDNLDDCYFYHTVDLPGLGVQKGEWDLRATLGDYLGNLDYKGKRALDVGTANGCLCFEMERRGARDVVGYDLSENYDWDGVPYNAVMPLEKMAAGRQHFRKMNNAFWLTRRLLNSKARMVNGTVYTIPQDIEPFDITVFGSILLHVRDPFLALQRAAAITRECMVVTDRYSETTQFVPDPATGQLDTWWLFDPQLIVKFLKVLGFPNIQLNFHEQKFAVTDTMIPMFTVIARK